MGITPLTLGLASIRRGEGAKIPDHKSGEMVAVTVRYVDDNPHFTLVYPSGFSCKVVWQDGQGFPGYTEGRIPFVQGGREGWCRQHKEKPIICQHK